MTALDPISLDRLSDTTLMMLRVLTGAFLIYGTLDNVFSGERMQEFIVFLTLHGFPWPRLMAPLSVYAQFLGGVLLVFGLLTRWAGVVVAINFAVAVVMVHWEQDFRSWWPAIVLVFLGLHFAARGGGRLALDALLWPEAAVRRELR
ncbi:MAG: DoxX family protein [Pseudomonadota bacterium]|nr:DoxX family protein [Pseudomonadota bacterium]